jgi:hypothetical protein
MTSANGLSLQTVGFNGKGMTFLLASSHRHSLLRIRDKKLTLGGKITAKGPTFCNDSNKIQGTVLADNTVRYQIVRYQGMLYKNPQAKLKVA